MDFYVVGIERVEIALFSMTFGVSHAMFFV